MIYTINLTPALDYTLDMDSFEIGSINKPKSESITIGGKGINVSLNLKSLGLESKVLTILAGFTGKYLKEQFDEIHLNNNVVFVDGLTRI
ncbi:MAG: 1-phosphofructokinase, partial [Clostridia bacterium]|nr:1-phosphofructokinase [Clostridia bacterium]